MYQHAPFGRPASRPVVIVGGGFSGVCLAIQLVRRTEVPLAVTLIDPSERPGRGLAYNAVDLDHRLNAPTFVHSLIPQDAWHLSRWCQEKDILISDPQASRADGGAYLRRSDFGRYLEETLQAHTHWPATGSSITHLRDTAVGISNPDEPLAVFTAAGRVLAADQVFAATGNPLPRLQAPFDSGLASHPAVIENALDTARLYVIAPHARVLLVGASLTALDALSTLIRRGHDGEIIVVSRCGLRPRPQGPLPAVLAKAQSLEALATLPGGVVLDRLGGPVPPFLVAPTVAPTARGWVRALRSEIDRVQAAGGTWYQPFDDLRDAVWQLWPTLPVSEKRRFSRTLRTWYDVHRFRSPPQNQELVDDAVAGGRVRFMAARLKSAKASVDDLAIEVAMTPSGQFGSLHERFDVVINCTGPDAMAGKTTNPFLSALAKAGRIRCDPCGIGFEVDSQCRAVSADGTADTALRLVGPPTVGSFGDPIGAMFIAAQIYRMLPDALRCLSTEGMPQAGFDDANISEKRQPLSN